MEGTMLGITLRERLRNEEIQLRTREPQFKWRWAGHTGRHPMDSWTMKISTWRSRETKRSVARQKRWRDDIQRIAKANWIQIGRHQLFISFHIIFTLSCNGAPAYSVAVVCERTSVTIHNKN